MNATEGSHTTRAGQNSVDIQDSMKPLRCVKKLFAMNCYTKSKTRCQKTCIIGKAAVCAVVLGFVNFYTLYVKIRDIFDSINVSIKLTDAIQTCYDYFQYLVDLFFVHKYGNGISSEYYERYVNIDQVLGITIYSSIKSRLVKLIIYFAIIWLASSVIDYAAWALSYGAFVPTIYAVNYIFLLIKMLNSLDLTSHVMHIEFRLIHMKDQLQVCYCTARSLIGNFNDPICNNKWFYCENTMKSSRMNILYPEPTLVSRNNHQEIKWLSRCYLNLLEQCVFINKMFGIRVSTLFSNEIV